ncbi:MAG TPA: hypothetical protein DEF79_02420 [Gammaproteobacteria bacterium]|nr:hypothetical protein [Gammaproteobacteria bacterium]
MHSRRFEYTNQIFAFSLRLSWRSAGVVQIADAIKFDRPIDLDAAEDKDTRLQFPYLDIKTRTAEDRIDLSSMLGDRCRHHIQFR